MIPSVMADEGCSNPCFEVDTSLQLGDSIETICFHHALNVFLVTTKDRLIRVFDTHSAARFTQVDLAQELEEGKISFTLG